MNYSNIFKECIRKARWKYFQIRITITKINRSISWFNKEWSRLESIFISLGDQSTSWTISNHWTMLLWTVGRLNRHSILDLRGSFPRSLEIQANFLDLSSMKAIKHLASILGLLSFRPASISGRFFRIISTSFHRIYFSVPLEILRQIQIKLRWCTFISDVNLWHIFSSNIFEQSLSQVQQSHQPISSFLRLPSPSIFPNWWLSKQLNM